MKIKEYVLKNYPKRFKNKNIIIEEGDSVYYIKTNKDESPLIINKNVKI
tara:strand:+ start:852 stop:998 length:147 start_codon:yes stop_codon:yes gene_type:complete